MAKRFKLNGYRVKRYSLLLVLVSILFLVLWHIMKSVSPVFKPPAENKPQLSLDASRNLKIDMQVDYQNQAGQKGAADSSSTIGQNASEAVKTNGGRAAEKTVNARHSIDNSPTSQVLGEALPKNDATFGADQTERLKPSP